MQLPPLNPPLQMISPRSRMSLAVSDTHMKTVTTLSGVHAASHSWYLPMPPAPHNLHRRPVFGTKPGSRRFDIGSPTACSPVVSKHCRPHSMRAALKYNVSLVNMTTLKPRMEVASCTARPKRCH